MQPPFMSPTCKNEQAQGNCTDDLEETGWHKILRTAILISMLPFNHKD